jgi:hypothetical protein
MMLKDKKFATRGLKVLPLEFQKLDPLTEWWYLVPEVDDDHCIQANPMATVVVNIKRKPGYYVKLGIGMLGLLTTLGFTSHSLLLESVPDRVNNVIGIIFTVLSLRFSLAEGMATVNYMTSMDVYGAYVEPEILCTRGCTCSPALALEARMSLIQHRA